MGLVLLIRIDEVPIVVPEAVGLEDLIPILNVLIRGTREVFPQSQDLVVGIGRVVAEGRRPADPVGEDELPERLVELRDSLRTVCVPGSDGGLGAYHLSLPVHVDRNVIALGVGDELIGSAIGDAVGEEDVDREVSLREVVLVEGEEVVSEEVQIVLHHLHVPRHGGIDLSVSGVGPGELCAEVPADIAWIKIVDDLYPRPLVDVIDGVRDVVASVLDLVSRLTELRYHGCLLIAPCGEEEKSDKCQ